MLHFNKSIYSGIIDSSMIGMDTLYNAEGTVAYALVFILAAVPWIELLVVIPPGIALGLDPLAVALLAFSGNLATVYLLVYAHHSLNSVWKRFRMGEEDRPSSGKKKKVMSIWDRYGLPGLALISPIITGTHLAALIALGLGSKKYSIVLWMSLSILIWTIVVTVASYYGIESLKHLLE
ncbi:hypothetical protein Mpsy_1091 [Methanolobus psychrophilus R15]|nr:hypothetical protein Mpsy_1091 [Methanolobus psychrophilus R15]